MRYIPNSQADRRQMLAEIGLDSIEQLFSGIPETLTLRRLLEIPKALTEPELLEYFKIRASKNASDYANFIGAGIYRHHIPIIIDALISRSEFYTAYTPYQAEIAQGTLQAIFEFQTYITQLTGMEVSNASLYDGSTGLAEAVLMAQRVSRKTKFIIAKSVHPEYRAVVQTYAKNLGIHIDLIDYASDGRVDLNRLEAALNKDVAAVVVQSPNFFGTIERTHDISELAHKHDALSIVNVCEAVSMGILKAPGDDAIETRTADIVVGEGQALGVPMSFGGPHVGLLATHERYMRQMPGRLVGLGRDYTGRRGFVLTLSTREQHIRREKATSNICTNQSLCALMATIYLATVGPR
ncbi:MAG: aminomethyl-transferring glycine dehydrogenase subunit GcvPA, partial [Acidobacteria bacterium]|nr:aminomethyl-transferring glycine dehydrogenase subunit GcvPA [Acidobacteriota bacterium]